MSEYQYYEFQAVDRRLGEMEMHQLRSYSTRARITPSSFVNEYSYGNFKGNADAWMEKYFDGYLYLANWGTHVLQMRVSEKLLSPKTAKLYCPGEPAALRAKSGNLIFTYCSDDEGGGDWVEGEGILSSLLPLRADLVRGDLRALYLGWLLCAQTGELDEDTVEPPVPPNLGQLTGPLTAFVDFLRIDESLVSVAAKTSRRVKAAPKDERGIAAWVASLPARQKDKVLVQLMKGDDTNLGAELWTQFERAQSPSAQPAPLPRRTVGELLIAIEGRG